MNWFNATPFCCLSGARTLETLAIVMLFSFTNICSLTKQQWLTILSITKHCSTFIRSFLKKAILGLLFKFFKIGWLTFPYKILRHQRLKTSWWPSFYQRTTWLCGMLIYFLLLTHGDLPSTRELHGYVEC